ncbi:hypothetical protein HDV00_012620, partial [Rhizophlyctis rosea]
MQTHLTNSAVPAIRALSTLPPEDGGGLASITKIIMDKLGMGGNEFASGGLTLAVLGALVAGARLFGGHFVDLMKRQFIVSAEFDSKDESYSWILTYLADHPMSKRTTRFSITTSISKPGQRLEAEPGEGYSAISRIYFLPSPGTHLFTYGNRLLWLSRERIKTPMGAGGVAGSPERITINCLGRNRTVLESLVTTAQKHFLEKDAHRTVIYAADQYGNWRRTRSKPVRPLSTVVLDGTAKETVVRDVREFLESEKWYADRGIPYRRGYMFYGKPGTGKTSFVTALAGELRFNIYVISLANKGLTDETLTELMVDTPGRCILLLEDIDAAFVSRTRETGEGGGSVGAGGVGTGNAGTTVTNVTFSGLLNAIDGVAAQEGRIVCMTTNHLEKLDPALIRPGRIDLQIHFDLATKRQARELFLQFYPHLPSPSSSDLSTQPAAPPLPYTEEELTGLAERFADSVEERRFSMAQIQGFLMRWKGDPGEAVRRVGDFGGGGFGGGVARAGGEGQW